MDIKWPCVRDHVMMLDVWLWDVMVDGPQKQLCDHFAIFLKVDSPSQTAKLPESRSSTWLFSVLVGSLNRKKQFLRKDK